METPLNGPDVGPPTLERIRRAPKVLLHDHLDGGLRPATIIELANEPGYADLPTADADELTAWMLRGANRKDLTLYLETFAHTVGVMQTAPAIERVAREWRQRQPCVRVRRGPLLLLVAGHDGAGEGEQYQRP